jgi:myosin heavy subunit
MFILKRTHESEIDELNRKLEIARDVYKIDEDINRKIIMDLGARVDALTELNDSKVMQTIELNEKLDNIYKQKQAWIEECLKKDQELEEFKNELTKIKGNYEIIYKDNLILMKDNARIFELKRQMNDKIEAVMLCSMNKIPKSEVLSKLSKKDIFEIIELFALM